MKKVIAIVFATVLLIGALTLPAAAFCPQGDRYNHVAKILNLTPAQQQKLLDVRQAFQSDTLPIRQHMQRTQLELRQLWAAPSLDQKQIQAKVRERTDLRIQLVQKRRDMIAQVKTVLTPDQLKTLEQYHHQSRHSFAFHRFGHRFNSQDQTKQPLNKSFSTLLVSFNCKQ